jgi:hypothetical protein
MRRRRRRHHPNRKNKKEKGEKDQNTHKVEETKGGNETDLGLMLLEEWL